MSSKNNKEYSIEKELIEKSKLLETTLNSIDQGFVVISEDYKMVACNKKYQELFGYPSEALEPGTHLSEIFRYLASIGHYGEGDIEAHVRKRLAAVEVRRRNREDITPTPSGLLLRTRFLNVAGYGFVATYTDVSELKQQEAELLVNEEKLNKQVIEMREKETQLTRQAKELTDLMVELRRTRDELQSLNEQKNRFFSIIAHDLKSPYSGMLYYSQKISDEYDTISKKDLSEYSKLLYDSTKDTYNLLESLLDWSRLQFEKITFEPRSLRLNDILETNVSRFEPIAKSKSIAITFESQGGKAVFADPNMADTVVRNVINNAIKFTPAGGRISVLLEGGNHFETVHVTDTGIGLSEQKMGRLFVLGSGEGSRPGTEGEQGTGLGLLLCKEIIDKHGGTISVTSRVDGGSTFSFSFPTRPPR